MVVSEVVEVVEILMGFLLAYSLEFLGYGFPSTHSSHDFPIYQVVWIPHLGSPQAWVM
jgi:hypothetical protein